MKIVIIGERGQAGQALKSAFSNSADIVSWNRPEYDITDAQISEQLADLKPELVINAAAWTNVDGAENNQSSAYEANMLGPYYIAEGCRRCGADLVQISTNEVFAGTNGSFYREYDLPGPMSIYARSKLAGEQAISRLINHCYIVRVSWLYGAGSNNFPSKIISAALKHGKLQVVDDEFGNPTNASDVAQAILSLTQTGRYGIYHLVNSGYTNRYEFAKRILQEASMSDIKVEPIALSEWPRASSPPPHAVLVNHAAAKLGIELRPWQEAISEYISTRKTEPSI